MIMADYRRLISYIYEYEGKKKGKNVGFAKLEARNGQCRINVNVKRIYMGGNAIGAYLLGTGGRTRWRRRREIPGRIRSSRFRNLLPRCCRRRKKEWIHRRFPRW